MKSEFNYFAVITILKRQHQRLNADYILIEPESVYARASVTSSFSLAFFRLPHLSEEAATHSIHADGIVLCVSKLISTQPTAIITSFLWSEI